MSDNRERTAESRENCNFWNGNCRKTAAGILLAVSLSCECEFYNELKISESANRQHFEEQVCFSYKKPQHL